MVIIRILFYPSGTVLGYSKTVIIAKRQVETACLFNILLAVFRHSHTDFSVGGFVDFYNVVEFYSYHLGLLYCNRGGGVCQEVKFCGLLCCGHNKNYAVCSIILL